MKALIDADILQWEFGSGTDSEGRDIPWPFVMSRVQGRIQSILEAVGATEHQLYLTSDDKSNFRYSVATIKPYKGNRKQDKPRHYYNIRNYLMTSWDAVEVYGMEADDAIAIEQYNAIEKSTVICSRDKDLNMVPGWHYSWGAGKQKEKELWWQDEISGLRCFYKQILSGDAVDNIPGIYGVGKSSNIIKRIDELDTEYDMYSACLSVYRDRFGSYAEQFLTENARLLWMLTEEGEIWQAPENQEEINEEEKED